MRLRLVTILWATFALVAGSPAKAQQAQRGCTARPNILVVALDAVRADATSLHPSPLNETPALAKLAAESVNFTHAYTTSDFVTAGLFSILTGFKRGHETPFDRVESSLPHQFGREGYRSFGVFANPHITLTGVRTIAAFDQRTNLSDALASLDIAEKEAATRKADELIALYGGAATDRNRARVFASPDEALSRTLAQLPGERPFFGLVSFSASDPWLPDPATYDRGKEPAAVPDLRERRLEKDLMFPDGIADDARREYVIRTIERARGRSWATTLDLTPEQVATYQARYHGEVRDIDRAIGALVDELRERQLLDTTILVVTSATGELMGETDLISGGFAGAGDYEAVRRVPLLMRLPPCYGVAAGSVDETVSTADIAHTLYPLSAIDAAQLWRGSKLARGRALNPLLSGLQPINVPVHRAYAPPLTPFGLVDDRPITVADAKSIAAKRTALRDYVWGKDLFPAGRMPDRVEKDMPLAKRPPNIRRIDRLYVDLAPGLTAIAYHTIPAKPNGKLVVVHQGHTCLGLEDPSTGVLGLISALLDRGYGVLGVEMPRQRRDDCGSVANPHDELFATLHGEGTAFRFFFEPLVASLNYLQRNAAKDRFPAYRQYDMVGFSGGGWTATVFAALDERIKTTISVAGSLPLYLRSAESRGDLEQRDPGFYRLAGYPDLYVMGSVGGRRQVHVLNRRDSCCFGAGQHPPGGAYDTDIRSYEKEVKGTLSRVGASADAFSVRIDETAESHTVTPDAVFEIILPALK